MKKIICLEVGVIQEDGERFDENVIFYDTLSQALEYGLKYVINGVERTYYMIWTYDIDDDCYVHKSGLIYSGDREIGWDVPYWEDLILSKIKINGNIQDLYKVKYCVGAYSCDCNEYFEDYGVACKLYEEYKAFYGEDNVFMQKEYWNEYTQDLDYCGYCC